MAEATLLASAGDATLELASATGTVISTNASWSRTMKRPSSPLYAAWSPTPVTAAKPPLCWVAV